MDTTLRTALEYAIRNERFVYVGSGSGWMYIGPADDKVIEFMECSNSTFYQNEVDRYNESVRRIDAATDALNILWKKASNDKKLEENRQRTIRYYVDRNERDSRRILNSTTKRQKWIPFLDRQIVDIHDKSLLEPKGIKIKFEGDEIGAFWTYDEFQRAKNKFRLGRVAEEKEEM